MSKVISFSISDRYLDKLRSLYPSLTDNLAVKQFVTDRLDGSLGNNLDASLDDGLDDRVKTLIESWVDGSLDERLDAAVGKLITSLSERMARIEARLDDSLDGSLDDMELLLRMQREASIATSPLPPSLPPDEPDQPAIGTLPTVETVEPISSINEPVKGAIEDSEKKIMEPVGGSDSLDTLPVPLITDKTIDQNAIATVPKTHTAIAAQLGLNSVTTINYWINTGIPEPYQDRVRIVERRGKKKMEWIT